MRRSQPVCYPLSQTNDSDRQLSKPPPNREKQGPDGQCPTSPLGPPPIPSIVLLLHSRVSLRRRNALFPTASSSWPCAAHLVHIGLDTKLCLETSCSSEALPFGRRLLLHHNNSPALTNRHTMLRHIIPAQSSLVLLGAFASSPLRRPFYLR